MSTDLSSIEIKKKLDGQRLPGRSTEKITEHYGGERSVMATKASGIMAKELKGKSSNQRKEWYKEAGMTYDEKKRMEQKFATKDTGLTWAQKERERKAQRGRISSGRNVADRISEERGAVGDKANRADKHLNRALQNDGIKTGADAIGAKRREYSVIAGGGGGVTGRGIINQQANTMHSNFSGQNVGGGSSTVKNTEAASVAGGFSVIKGGKGVGGGAGKSSGSHIPLSKAA